MTVRSSYNIIGGFGIILGLNIYVATLPWQLFPRIADNLFTAESWKNESTRFLILYFVGIQVICLLLLMTQCKKIKITGEHITFINPLLSFIRKKRNFSDYDCFHTVHERSLFSRHESVWLVRDNRLKDRISKYYYDNYPDIKAAIKTEYRGELEITEFRKLLCWFGCEINSE